MSKRAPLPPPNVPIVAPATGLSEQSFWQWLQDAARALMALSNPTPGVPSNVTPAFPASGATTVNNTGSICNVYCGGGNITSITVNGVLITSKPVNSFNIPLSPGDSLAFTYTSTPDWFWKPIGV